MPVSLIAKVLDWVGLPQWALELIALGIVAGGIWYWHHATYQAGVAAEVAAVKQQSAIESAQLAAKALTAEHQHDQELSDLRDYRSAHPDEPVRLCNDRTLRTAQTVAATKGPRATTSASAVIQSLPGGNSGIRAAGDPPDISGMLSALAEAADAIDAQARALQDLAQ